MAGLTTKAALTAAVTAALWVVPSIGTQGMGTLGQRFSHPDDSLVAGVSNDTERTVLQRVDARVMAALAP